MPVPVAIVGCGGVSEMHLDGCAQRPERVRVVACCDLDPARVQRAQEKYDIPQGFASVEKMLAGASFDAVIVCTPTSVRAAVVAALADAGKPMLVEKPMASTLAEAEAMVTACEAAGVALAVDQNFRWHYPFHLAKARIAEGLIGPVQQILHQDLFFRQDSGWRIEQPRHALMVMGVHWLDGFRWILGCEATSVSALMRSSPAIDCAGETEASVQVLFEGGPIGTYVQSFSSPLARTETVILGEWGALVLDYQGLSFGTQRWPNPYAGAAKPASAFAALEELLTAVEQGREPENSGQDNLRTITLLEAAYRSTETGAVVTLAEGRLT